MSTETLTSLAMLKVHVDQGQDYLEYLRPFVLQVLATHSPDPVTDTTVRTHIKEDFGLEIPGRTIQIMLRRISRKYPLKKEGGVYRITGKLPNPGIDTEKTNTMRQIDAVISGLREFSQGTAKPIESRDEAVAAICTFLAQFNIPCLRAYLRGTTIPTIDGSEDQHHPRIVLMSKYVLDLQNTDPERFEGFLVVLKGHMLANALLCPDLGTASKSYDNVTFYLDTPLLVRQLGLDGEQKQAAVKNLVDMLLNLGATVATFSHSRDELESVITGAADRIESESGRGAIVMEARRSGTTKSDLLVLAGQVNDKLRDARINVLRTPPYIKEFQIGETAFENALTDEVSYLNPHAKEYDIDSVRSIYVLREGTSPTTLERSKAVLVTSNTAFSRVAYEYGKKHEESRAVSSVITDFSLANMAWLKAPLKAPDVPMTELLAFSYAALQPSKKLLDKYMNEIEKLNRQGKITPRDHQILRSNLLAQTELMNLTLGEEDALTEQTITEMLDRVTKEVRKEESEKYRKELAAHQETQKQLDEQRTIGECIQKRLHKHCQKRAKMCALCVSIIVTVLLVGGLAAGVGLGLNNHIEGWLLAIALGVLSFLTLSNLIFGTTVKHLHEKVYKHCLTWLISRKAAETGLDLTGNNDEFR